MLIIDNLLVSDELLEEKFVCDLNACKGACCWEGDWGAPLESAELEILKEIYEDIKPYLTDKGREAIEAQGKYVWIDEVRDFATTLIDNGPCAYIAYDALGRAQCGIEQAWRAGKTHFRKPISCHLYPIRVTKLPDYEALNYHEWEICSAACALGEKLKVPVFQFLKEALIRKYGEEVFAQMEEYAKVK